MQHQIRKSTGLTYRTKPMDPRRARAFARCLSANPAFCAVEIFPAKTAALQSFVTFIPANHERQADMLEREDAKRQARADAEGDAFIFWRDPDFVGVVWCFNPATGNTYRTDCFSCDCADFTFRAQFAGVQCKHLKARQAAADSGRLAPPASVASATLQDRFAAAGLDVNRDF